jgi:hypothetical protein
MNIALFAVSYDNLAPSQRKILSSDWLETAKAYYSNHKNLKAKNCLKYSNELYPMGTDAAQARELLKKYFNITVQYDAESQFKTYVNNADSAQDVQTNYILNNLLMASEIKQDKDVLYRIAVLYNSQDDKVNASKFLKKALDAGYSPDSVEPDLKDIIK